MQRKKKSSGDVTTDAAESPSKAKEVKATVVTSTTDDRWKWFARASTSIAMFGGFLTVIWLGPLALVGLVFLLQAGGYHELCRLRNDLYHIGRGAGRVDYAIRRPLDIAAFLFFSCFFYLLILFVYFPDFVRSVPLLVLLRDNLLLITPYSFIFGMCIFAVAFKKNCYREQCIQLAWVGISMIVISMATPYAITIIYGLFWFIIPTLSVITNDTTAFFCGYFFGRHPLIEVSPKKTWEGYLGGALCTYVVAFIAVYPLAHFDFAVCPRTEFLAHSYECERHATFVPFEIALPEAFGSLTGVKVLPIYPVHWHVFVIATFVSFVGPFGGFIASGFKRAHGVKDFANLIPGHGGLADRFDCQVLTATFTAVYVSFFVKPFPVISPSPALQSVLDAVSHLSASEVAQLRALL